MHLTLAATHFGVQQTVLNLNDVAQNDLTYHYSVPAAFPVELNRVFGVFFNLIQPDVYSYCTFF